MDIKHYKFNFISKLISYILFFLIFLIIFLVPLIVINRNFSFPDSRFLNALFFGLKTSIIATILSGIFGIPAGFYLARNNGIFINIMDSIFEIPIIIPPLVLGALLLIFLNLSIIKTFYSFIFTIKGAIIAQFFISFPYTLKASKNAFELVPPIYEKIAMTLGATPFRSFYDTTFKLSFGSVFTGLILSWIRSFGEFGATLLVGGGITGKTENIPIYIYMNMTQGNFEKGLSASIFIVILGFIFLFLVKRKFN